MTSQDTSAYGVDIKYRTGFWQGRPVKTKMQALCEALGEMGVWVRLHCNGGYSLPRFSGRHNGEASA